ncbi:voltage-dependent calcium channel gamma-8 subunit-like [Hetaerina americana]|uniref:voltage-dependent calcium channel gamma-8 subunit-like n=1 Tax=Hetaerina americana TaxID=62018 RepID=UPI003A7F100D
MCGLCCGEDEEEGGGPEEREEVEGLGCTGGSAGGPKFGSSRSLSRLAVLCGILSMASLLAALLGSSWIFTMEPVKMPPAYTAASSSSTGGGGSSSWGQKGQPPQQQLVSATITFRIGLWKVCPSVRKHNASLPLPSPACSLVKYFSWDEVKHSDLGVWAPIEFTPSFISRMRISTPLEGAGLALLLSATLCALLGHCSNDHRTLVACGLFILGGLSLGCGLVVFASVLSDAYMERPRVSGESGGVAYQYGWSFFAAASAFIAAQLAALLSVTAYVRRFPTPEALLLKVIPGGVEAAGLTAEGGGGPAEGGDRRKWRWRRRAPATLAGEPLFSRRPPQYILRRGRRLVDMVGAYEDVSTTTATAASQPGSVVGVSGTRVGEVSVPGAEASESAQGGPGGAEVGGAGTEPPPGGTLPSKARPCSVPTPPDVCHSGAAVGGGASEQVVVVVGGVGAGAASLGAKEPGVGGSSTLLYPHHRHRAHPAHPSHHSHATLPLHHSHHHSHHLQFIPMRPGCSVVMKHRLTTNGGTFHRDPPRHDLNSK